MKKVIKNNVSIMSLILAIIFLIIGAVMFTRPEFIVLVFSYVMGGIIILFGVYNCIKNYIEVKKDNNTSSKDMIIGITSIVIGLIFIFLANVIEAVVRLVIGGYILFIGLNRFINALYIKKKDSRFITLLIISLILMGGGLYTILEANLAFQTMGIVIMIYAILEIIGYIFNISIIKKNDAEVTDAILIEEKKD